MAQSIQEHLDKTYLMLLERGGVDNWEWYGESLGEYSEYKDYVKENSDNYDSYDEWIEKQNEVLPESETSIDEKPKPVKPEMSKQNKLLLEYVQRSYNEETAYKIVDVMILDFWKYNTNPKEFKKAMALVSRGDNYVFRAAQIYLNLMIKTGKIDKIIKYVVEERI